VRALLWSLFAWSAWDQAATVLEAQLVWALLWPLIGWSVWAYQATVLAGTTGEGAGLISSRLVVVDSDSHCGGGHDRLGSCSGLCSLGRRGLNQPML
jgi:hypothetical protein